MSPRVPPPRLHWLPLFVLALGLLATVGGTWTLSEISASRAALRFTSNTVQMRAAIETRMSTQISLLRGVAGLFAASDSVDREAFRRYVDRLGLPTNYPGVQGVGFTARVRPQERAAFEAQARAMGLEGFRIWPEEPRAEYHSILFLEPLDQRNRAALGFDMFTEATRREAMARARDSGAPALSGPVTLIQEQAIDEERQAGFLIYVPVYASGQIPDDLHERRDQLIGFVYSPFRADDLFQGIFGASTSQRLLVEIYDGIDLGPEALLHRSVQPTPPLYVPSQISRERIVVAGRPWTIMYSSLPTFDAAGDAYITPLALIVGTISSLVLFLLVQAQTRARHEAEQAVSARDSFLSIASHELKTPLTALLGNAQLLERRVRRSNSLSAGERHNLAAVIEGGRRLNRLVDELLDHTRLQEGRLTLDLRPLELDELVRRVADEVRPSLPRHHLLIEGADEPLPVMGDGPRLERVLLNLIGNAAKYSPAGGPIKLELERADQWAVVKVRDQGIGIPEAAMPHLFEQFYRAPNAVARSIPGMGIGLHVVRELVERHSGAIQVASAEGEGSVFEMRLPLAKAALSINEPAHRGHPQAPASQP